LSKGYLNIDKEKTVLTSSVVAVLEKKRSKERSRVVLTKGNCYTKTSPQTLTERLKKW